MRAPIYAVLTACLVLISSVSAAAEYDFGLNLVVDLPQEDFANISGAGGGVGLKILRPLSGPWLRLRGDFELLFFGEEEHAGDVYGFEGSVITRHESIRLLAGVELSSPPSRSWRVYVAPAAGLYYFRSIDRIQWTVFHETSSSEVKFGWKLDAGMTFTRFKRPHRPRGLEIDFGVSYGTVRNAIDREIEEVTVRTDANEFMVHAGVIWHVR